MQVRADDLKPGMYVKGCGWVKWAGRSARDPEVVVTHYENGQIDSLGCHPDNPVDVLGPIFR